jgi:hypothetical protein
MNSDPYDSAAWRTFGMLDADESAIFDEAMRHDPVLRSAWLEMDRLSAAIAASTVPPVEPRAGQIERLQNRLGLYQVKRSHWWLGLSGWAAAAVLALLLVFTRGGGLRENAAAAAVVAPAAPIPPAPEAAPPAPVSDAPAGTEAVVAVSPSGEGTPEETVQVLVTPEEPDGRASVKVETKRLIQEIEVLRESLQRFHERDRVLFEPVPGVALPIVMTMAPPGATADEGVDSALKGDQGSITAMLGDAIKSSNTRASSVAEAAVAPSFNQPPPLDPGQLTEELPAPSAIPIYDAARDAGTLVVSNLPATAEGEVYNLWVNTQSGDRPVYVGSLPQNSETGVDSFDFSLGSTMVLPSGFILTKDPVLTPSSPTEINTVLQGPPPP